MPNRLLTRDEIVTPECIRAGVEAAQYHYVRPTIDQISLGHIDAAFKAAPPFVLAPDTSDPFSRPFIDAQPSSWLQFAAARQGMTE